MTDEILISADSHVVEPPVMFEDYLDRRWRSDAPRLVRDEDGGDCYAVPGSTRSIGLGLAAAAGTSAAHLRETGTRFRDIRLGAWQPGPRLDDQDRDGVAAEVIYPTVSLFLFSHVNQDLVAACMKAYSRWIAEFCSESPDRLIGCGASAVLSPHDASRDLHRMRGSGLRGALLPLRPAIGSYVSDEYDALWATASELGLPLTFHALPPSRRAPTAGPAAAAILPLWDAQELLTGLVLQGVLHRWPRLQIVFAEFDAGWVPHLADRLDHYFDLHYKWLRLDRYIDRPPSEYISRAVHFTFQDDSVAALLSEPSDLNLMWASDFPHAESTWPSSRAVIGKWGQLMPESLRQRACYGLAQTLYQEPK